MSSMADQIQAAIRKYRKFIVGAMAIAIFLGFLCVILGGIHFVGPVMYPVWVSSIWIILMILLGVFIELHLIVYMVLTLKNLLPTLEEAMPTIIGVAFLAVLLGGWGLIAYRHFATFSILAFAVLCLLTLFDYMLWMNYRDSGQ